MTTNNKIFFGQVTSEGSAGPSINRPQWDNDAYKDLNTYRNFNPIGLIVEPVFHDKDTKDEDAMPFQDGDKHFEGRHSLFNSVNAVGNNFNYMIHMNAPLLDTPKMREIIRQKSDCSVKALVNASERGEMGRAIYTYADFMFCKHLGRISNNYLVTLRRFPFPAGDHINYTMDTNELNDHMPDIGRLVTWMGTPGNEMSNILKFSVNLPYKQMKAGIQTATENADNSGGFLGGLMNLGSTSYQQGMLRGSAGNSGIGFIQKAATPIFGRENFTNGLATPPNTSWAYHRDENKVYGPVDAITETNYRQGAEDGGIKFEHNITLTFDYELRSFDGINTRAAFLDLLANILAVTFTNATYWGGSVRGTGAAQSNIFANLPIFKLSPDDMTFTGLTDKILDSVSQMTAQFNNGVPVTDLKSAMNALSNLAKGVFTGLTAGALNAMGRPARNALNSLLSFQPTGLWHLTIGNPRHPIMSMGNMILDNCTIEQYGPLGLDDFPTGLRVVIALKHGMPRDNLKIEQMYMNGDFRIYQPLGNRTYIAWETAEELGATDNISTNNLPETADGILGNLDIQTTEDKESKKGPMSPLQKRLFKYFGTDNKENIINAGMEGYLGSQPRKKKQTSGTTNNGGNNKKKS